jgi:putative nucleotidyltransferase with HDIG domain
MGADGTKTSAKRDNLSEGNQDPVIGALRSAEAAYVETRNSLDEQIRSAQGALASAEKENRKLSDQLEKEQARVERYRMQARQTAECLKDMHGALFSGNIYDLILNACITVTGATRGLYLTAKGGVENLRVRAARDVDGYPKSPPSKFIRELCRKALQEQDTVVCHSPEDLEDLPEPSREGERFHNCVTAPVVLLRNFDGIVIVADKMQGQFDEEDVETLLSVGDQAAVAVENIRLQRELQSAYLSTVSMLADAVEAKDPSTHGHCEMVSRYARLTARRLGMSDEEMGLVCYGALLHDVGKIGVSDGILNKPGPLLPEERELVRSHVRVGYDLLARVPALQSIARVVLHHHEWYDGSGYPDGLKGDEIPLAARIICVVDAYCAMVTKRSYKEAYSDGRARDELKRCSGTQFDPRVVDAFLAMLDTPESEDEDEDYDAECGLLPGFTQLRDNQQAVYV